MDDLAGVPVSNPPRLNVDEFSAFIAQATGLKIRGPSTDTPVVAAEKQQQQQLQKQQPRDWRDGRGSATVYEYGAGIGVAPDSRQREIKGKRNEVPTERPGVPAVVNSGRGHAPNRLNNNTTSGGLSSMFSTMMVDDEETEVDAHVTTENRPIDGRQVGYANRDRDSRGNGSGRGRGRGRQGGEKMGGGGRSDVTIETDAHDTRRTANPNPLVSTGGRGDVRHQTAGGRGDYNDLNGNGRNGRNDSYDQFNRNSRNDSYDQYNRNGRNDRNGRNEGSVDHRSTQHNWGRGDETRGDGGREEGGRGEGERRYGGRGEGRGRDVSVGGRTSKGAREGGHDRPKSGPPAAAPVNSHRPPIQHGADISSNGASSGASNDAIASATSNVTLLLPRDSTETVFRKSKAAASWADDEDSD